MSRLIIALTGDARSGKDTAADRMVSEHGFVRIALADEVRRAALAINPWIPMWPNQDPGTDEDLQLVSGASLRYIVEAYGWDEAKTIPAVRRTLQKVGTEGGWQIHGEDLWTKLADAKIALLEPDTPVVVTDARMPHEQSWIDRVDAVAVKVVRPDNPHRLQGEAAKHLSELGGIHAEATLMNKDTIIGLHRRVDTLVQELLAAKEDR